MSFFDELRRRNVFRVGIAYLVVAWLVLQVTDTVAPILELPDVFDRGVLLLLAIGFPLALFFAWAFELTPEGLKKEQEVDRAESVTQSTGRKLDYAIIGLLAITLAYFVFDKFTTDVPQSVDDPVVTTIRPSIAVLPFADMSPGKDQDYFSDGISEELLNLLARIPNLKVIGRTSSFAFKGKNEDLRVIGEKLDVKMVLEGSVRTSGDRVRITAQLINVADGSHLWSDTYDRTLIDIFAIQDDVAAAIIGALQIHVGAMPTRGRPTDNTEAYALFLKARALFSSAAYDDSVEAVLLRAIELDPNFAEAYELLARRHWSNLEQQKALDAAARALAIDPDLALAQAVYQSANIGSHLAGVEAFEQALRKQPVDPLLLQSLVWNYSQAGYFREAVGMARRMVEVDPLSSLANLNLGIALDFGGHTNEADAAWGVYSQLSGDDLSWYQGEDSLLAKQDEQAIAHFENALQQLDYPETSWVRELITNARDPVTGQAYLDRRIPEVIAATAIGSLELHEWYLFFGFLDRYIELLLENDPNDSRWALADHYLYEGVFYARRTGFTAHPNFLEVAETMGIIKIWEKRGPPDMCDKVDGQWVCE